MNCQPSLLSWGDPSIAWIAEHLRTPWLSQIMVNISELGHSGPIFAAIALGYWFWNKHNTKYIAYGVFFALLINLWLKGIVMECRPPSEFWMEKGMDSYSFPSGHAQVSIALWAGFAYYIRSKWLSSFFLIIGFLIALSRPYMGVHYIHDIVVGLLLGLVALGMSIFCEKKQFAYLKAIPLKIQAPIVLLGLSFYNLMVNNPSGSYIGATGAFFGFWLGCQWVSLLNLNPQERSLPSVFQCVTSFGIMFLLLTKINFSEYDVSYFAIYLITFIQYMLVGLWVSFGAPLFFMRGSLLRKKVAD